MALARNWKRRFIDTLRETANVRMSCKQAGIPRSSAYYKREKDSKFAAEWDEAIEDAVDSLELAATARAVNGLERRRPIWMKVKDAEGNEIVQKVDEVVEREYSDTLLIFLLKAHRPEKYRERYEVKNTGVSKIEVVYVEQPPDQDPEA